MKKPAGFVTIGGREVTYLEGALIAQEADRRGLLPGEVGEVVLPEPAPTHVELAGLSLSLETGAHMAMEADARGIHLKKLIESILIEQTEALERRARTRNTKRPLEGARELPPDPKGGNRGK